MYCERCRKRCTTTVNPDTIGCVWTGKVDLNMLRVDEEIFESGKKKLQIQKHPNTCGRGLRLLPQYNSIVVTG